MITMVVVLYKVHVLLYFIAIICTASSDKSLARNDDQTGQTLQTVPVALIMDNSDTTAVCRRDNEIYRSALANYTPWAVQMYDASAKIPSGILTGNYIQLGNYDECLEVKSNEDFFGKACSATVEFSLAKNPGNETVGTHFGRLMHIALSKFKENSPYNGISFEWLWCLPSSCNRRDFANFLEGVVVTLTNGSDIQASVEVPSDACHTIHTDHYLTFDAIDWCYLFVLMMFGIIIIFSTACDLQIEKYLDGPRTEGLKYSIITSYSVYTNGKILLSTVRSNDAIRCLDSIRFLSICCIIYSHFVHFVFKEPQLNAIKRDTILQNRTSSLTLNTLLAVDTFLLLSGILLTYNELGRRRRGRQKYRFDVLKYYIYRYIRITPAYTVMIGFYSTIFYKTGTGPWWNRFVGSQRSICINDWWKNLLFTNSFDRRRCMSQSWYLSVDMLLHWIAPIFLYPMVYKGVKHIVTLCMFAMGIIIVILSTFVITYTKRSLGVLIFFYPQTPEYENYATYIYTRVYTRAGPFIVGLVLGYLLRNGQRKPPIVKFTWILCGWTVAISVALAVVFGPRKMYHRDYKYNPLEAALYVALHRIAFSCSVGWVIVATQFGYSGPLGTLLNWSGWVPFSKLTYCMYLTHFMAILYDLGTVRTPRIYSTWTLAKNYLGILNITFIPSVILCLCFEMPFVRLIRAIRGDDKDAALVVNYTKLSSASDFQKSDNDPQSVIINLENFETRKRNL